MLISLYGQAHTILVLIPIAVHRRLNFLLPWKFFMNICRLLIVFKINFFEKFFQKHHLSVKQFGSRSGANDFGTYPYCSARKAQLFASLEIFHEYLLSADCFRNQLFRKILSEIPSECETVWIQIRPDIDLGPKLFA